MIRSQDWKGVLRYPEPEHMYNLSVTSERVQWEEAYCWEKLTDGRFYWEVQWSGFVSIELKTD